VKSEEPGVKSEERRVKSEEPNEIALRRRKASRAASSGAGSSLLRG
jgi:hypothetical protein